MAKVVIMIMVSLTMVLPSMAQQERKFIREGNDLFHKQDFEKAEVEYRKALDTESDSYAAGFNLGDAMYKQKKYEEALQQFASLAKDVTDKEKLGELYHNIGNTLLAMNKLDESIEAYKQSLRNRPDSQETKYNLEFARKQKQDQQNQQNQVQNKDQNQDQNKDQQNQDQQNKDQQNKDQQDQNKDQQNKDQQNKDQQNQQNQQNQQEQQNQQNQQEQQGEGKISKEDAKRLLDALEADEKKTQEKVQNKKVQALKAKKMKIEKNW